MKGQAKALIPALIGIAPLLLAGITGYVNSSGGQQATPIATTSTVTDDQRLRMELADSFRADAKAAAIEIRDSVTADLAVQLTHTPSQLVASSDAEVKDRG